MWEGGRIEMYREFWWGNTKEIDHVLDLGVIVGIILKIWHEVDWIYVNQVMARRRNAVDTYTILWVHKMLRNFLAIWERYWLLKEECTPMEWFQTLLQRSDFSHTTAIVYITFPQYWKRDGLWGAKPLFFCHLADTEKCTPPPESNNSAWNNLMNTGILLSPQ